MNISKINVGGTLYNIQDAALTAQVAELIEDISSLTGALKWIGFTSTALVDGSTTNPITIEGQSVTAVAGNVAGYNPTKHSTAQHVRFENYGAGFWSMYINASGEVQVPAVKGTVYYAEAADSSSAEVGKYYIAVDVAQDGTALFNEHTTEDASKGLEFVYNGSAWQEFGSTGSLGALAFKDSVQATYTPAGTVTAPSVTISGGSPKNLSTTTIIGVSDSTETASRVTDVSKKAVEIYEIPQPSSVSLSGKLSTSKLETTTIKGVGGTVNLHDTPTLVTTDIYKLHSAPSTGQSLYYMAVDDNNETLVMSAVTVESAAVGTSLTAGTQQTVATAAQSDTRVATGGYSQNEQHGSTIVTGTQSGATVLEQTNVGGLRTIRTICIDGDSAADISHVVYDVSSTNVTVPIKNAAATTVATGGTDVNGTGAQVITALPSATATAPTFDGTQATITSR